MELLGLALSLTMPDFLALDAAPRGLISFFTSALFARLADGLAEAGPEGRGLPDGFWLETVLLFDVVGNFDLLGIRWLTIP
jgi:hypothetical protein